MSSIGHDFILEMIHIKLKKMGYKLTCSESRYKDIKFAMPPTISHHRPDTIGYNNNSICIGEAKYYGDFNSQRSHTQIKDFIMLTKDNNIKVIFGFPLSEREKFFNILKKEKIELNSNIALLEIPDRLIPKNEEK